MLTFLLLFDTVIATVGAERAEQMSTVIVEEARDLGNLTTLARYLRLGTDLGNLPT